MSKIGKVRKYLYKIQGVAYLLRQQKIDENPPMNMEELNYGIGMTLMDLAGNALNQLDERQKSKIEDASGTSQTPDSEVASSGKAQFENVQA